MCVCVCVCGIISIKSHFSRSVLTVADKILRSVFIALPIYQVQLYPWSPSGHHVHWKWHTWTVTRVTDCVYPSASPWEDWTQRRAAVPALLYGSGCPALVPLASPGQCQEEPTPASHSSSSFTQFSAELTQTLISVKASRSCPGRAGQLVIASSWYTKVAGLISGQGTDSNQLLNA